jgi:hypothetical protein
MDARSLSYRYQKEYADASEVHDQLAIDMSVKRQSTSDRPSKIGLVEQDAKIKGKFVSVSSHEGV